MRPGLCSLLLLASGLAAQTYVVDAANGPGANFTSLPAAVAAVPDGSILLVRPGGYLGFTMTGKGLAVLGDAGVVIQGTVTIGGTTAAQSVTLRNLTWAVVPTTVVLGLSNCQGPVLLEGISQPATPFGWPCGTGGCSVAVGIRATACAQLYLRDCDVRCTVALDSCHAVLESCFVRGEDHAAIYITNSPLGNPPRSALVLTDTNAQVCGRSRFEGGWGGNLGLGNHVQGGSGIEVQNGALRMLDGEVVAGMSGLIPLAHTIEVRGVVQLRIAPRVVLTAAFGWPTQGPQVGADVMPATTGAGAPAGGTLTATTTTEPGDLVVLAVGLPGPAVMLPRMLDPFWLDPAAHVFVALGVHQTGTPVNGSVAVPPGPAFVGVRLNWQAVCRGPVTGFQASNPVVTLVR